jgi:hypothetical protein
MEKVIDKVILWGCSIGYGLNADKDKIFGQRIADDLGVPFINLSISGAGNIVGANVILNKPIEFFKNALVLFQTTYFERQLDKDLLPNPFYDNRFYKEVFTNTFSIEDFEDPLNLNILVDQNTSAIKSTPTSNIDLQSFNGNFYGLIQLNPTDSSWIASTQNQLAIAKGREAYLEVDYYNSNSITTGLIYVKPDNSTVNNPNIRLQAQDQSSIRWKKIYIDLKELIGYSPNGSNFLQSFIAYLDEGKSEGEIRIDNIKVVYFN